jgi:ligand-binding sensor domain-containing protein
MCHRYYKNWFLFAIFFFWLQLHLYAQTTYKANIYTTKDGLSSDLYRSIYRDKAGFVWISTDKGLNRFDGNSFYTFKHRPDDKYSIANNSCNEILEDSKGRIWINTDDGLSLFDAKKQTFKNYYPDTTVMPNIGISYTEMAEDDAGKIWIGGYYDVLLFNPVTEKFEKSGWYDFAVKSGLVKVEKRNNISQSVVRKSDTELWLMTVYGLFSVHTPTKTFTYHPNADIEDYFAFVIRYVDDNGVLWIGTYDQCFYTFDPRNQKWTHHSCPPRSKGVSDLIFNINKFDEETLLITRTDEILSYNISTKEFKIFDWSWKDERPKVGYYSHTLVSGDDIYILKSGDEPFIHLTKTKTLVKKTKIPLPKTFVNNHSYVTKSGKILTGDWDKNAVLVCDTLKCKVLTTPDGNDSLGNLQLYYVSKDGNQYFSTSMQVFKWSESENIVQALDCPKQYIQENQTEFRNFVEDIRGNMYIRERTKGIFILKKGKNNPVFFDCGIVGNNFSALYYDKATDKLWLATEKSGLYIIDPNTRTSKNYPLPSLSQKQKGFIYDISGDDYGNVFLLVANRGMIRINSRDMIPKLYTTSDGLLSDAVKYSFMGNHNKFWFTSESGLMAFDYKNERFYSFESEEDSKLFNYRIFQDEKGNIAQNLYPDQIISIESVGFAEQKIENKIYLKEVKLSGKIIPNDSIFRVSYDENNFVFLFGNLGLTGLRHQVFRYRINGQSWQSLENNAISLYNLAHGSYRIQVGNKYEENDLFTLIVVVVPPWWKTIWFYSVLFLLIFIAGYLAYKKRISDIRKEETEKNKLKERITQIEMTALRAQMNPHFIFNCLNSINRFILVSNMDAASEYLTKFSRLIRMILDASREDFVSLDRELEALKLYIGMEAMRFQDSFQWQIHVDKDIATDNIMLPPLMLQPYVENAIWHGLMQAPSDWGVKYLDIRVCKELQGIIIEIEDNGIGREKAQKLKSKTGDGHKSYGISLTEERIRLMEKIQGVKTDIVIEDLFDEQHHPKGTKVSIIINS